MTVKGYRSDALSFYINILYIALIFRNKYDIVLGEKRAMLWHIRSLIVTVHHPFRFIARKEPTHFGIISTFLAGSPHYASNLFNPRKGGKMWNHC